MPFLMNDRNQPSSAQAEETLPALPEPLESALAELLEKQFNLGFATAKQGPKALHTQHPQIKAAGAAIQCAVYEIRAAIAAQTAPRIDVEALIAACLPGGWACDPQAVADAIREWAAAQTAPDAQQAVTYHGLTLDQVKANLALLNADDLRGLVVSLLIQESIAESAAAHAQQPLTDAQIEAMRLEAADQGLTGIPPSRHLARAVERHHGIPAPTTGEGA